MLRITRFRGWLVMGLILVLVTGCSPAAPATVATTTHQPTALFASLPTQVAPTVSPNPVETESSEAGVDTCLIGTWYVKDFNSYMVSVVPAEAIQKGEISYKDTTGEMQYIFNPDGTVLFKAVRFTIESDLKMGDLLFPLVITIDGNASAHYAITNQNLTFSDQQPGDAVVSITLTGTPLMDASSASKLIWWNSADNPQPMAYTCSTGTMELTPPIDLASVKPVVFARMDH